MNTQAAPGICVYCFLILASLIALGRHYSAMFTHGDSLSAQLFEEDMERLDSDFADIANMGDGAAVCVVAALFLSQFSQAFRWAHLDVSGTAKIHGEDVGATGRPAALLMQFLMSEAEALE